MAAAIAEPPGNDLKRSQRALISSHWSNIVDNIVPPGVAWEWDECGVEHRTKYRWKCAGLIYRSPNNERWMTSQRLWLHVIEAAGADETVGGEATGEQLLINVREYEAQLEHDDGEEGSRTLTDPDPSAWKRSTIEQSTLDGVMVEIDNDANRAVVNMEKGQPTKDPREKAAEAAGQARLTAFTSTSVLPATFDPVDWLGPRSKSWKESLTS